jgi:hypothetical protein
MGAQKRPSIASALQLRARQSRTPEQKASHACTKQDRPSLSPSHVPSKQRSTHPHLSAASTSTTMAFISVRRPSSHTCTFNTPGQYMFRAATTVGCTTATDSE